jgi:hypothetical protein
VNNMKDEILAKLQAEERHYEEIRQELLKVEHHLRNYEEVDRLINLLGESNKSLDNYRKLYTTLMKNSVLI